MRVLLIVPTNDYNKGLYPSALSLSDFPQGFGYIAAALKEHEVHGLNLNNIVGYANAFDMIANRISRALVDIEPDIIGTGGLVTDYRFLKHCIAIVRKSRPYIPIVIGGGIVTHDKDFIFRNMRPDVAIVSEAEETMRKLLNNEPSPNIMSWKDEQPTYSGDNFDFGNLDDRPFPDYEPFDVKRMLELSDATRMLYKYPRTYPRPWPLVTARSCPFRCSFCVHDHGPKYRARSVGNIMAEIKVVYDKYQPNIFILSDELFAVNQKRMREFCETLISEKSKNHWDFDWMFQTHASARLDAETLKLAKASGCYFFSYGLESASPTILRSMNKETTPGQIKEAIKLADNAGIGFGGNLLFGDPAETPETMSETLEFMFRYMLDIFIGLGPVQPYPGSRLFQECLERELITDKAAYYERVNEFLPNMTKMNHETLSVVLSTVNMLSRCQCWVRTGKVKQIEKEGLTAWSQFTKADVYQITALCPHCGWESIYRESVRPPGEVMSIMCQNCNKRYKLYVHT